LSSERRYEEFRELQATAMRYLAQPTLIPSAPDLNGWDWQIRLWHFPSFDAHRVWVFGLPAQAAYVLTRRNAEV
jgi:hypothetical protein